MRRYPSTSYASTFSFGPGPLSTLLKALIGINVAVFVVQLIEPGLTRAFGLRPADVVEGFRVWQLATYMFLHGGVFHLLFNMLALWMFGTELERMWGTHYFLTVLVSLPSNEVSAALYSAVIIGASGAIYGLLLAFALYFPDRPIYLYMVFPIPAKYFVMIIGALAFYSSLGQSSGVASATHLGGLLVGYLYLKNGRMQPLGELKYRYLKWKMNRARRKFDVYSGGRANDYDRRIH
jgi:membrane associated rhomboid family serine protease